MEEAISADTKVDEHRLDARLDIDDASLVDVADDVLVGDSLDVEFFEDAIFNDGNSRLLREERVNEHFFLHESLPFVSRPGVSSVAVCGKRDSGLLPVT